MAAHLLLGSLSDSRWVARFQRCCGLFPAAHEGRGAPAGTAGNGGGPLLPPPPPPPQPQPGQHRRPPWRKEDSLQEYVVKNYFYYYLFRISAAMGQEVFYITFLPLTYWSINPYIARRLIIMWSVVMYIGQVTKDLLKWPRPSSPPVVKLEGKTNAEYGMPSTHAMAATAISFTFLAAAANQYKYPVVLGVMGASLFSTLVGLSRIYTGMHTALDVIVGCLVSALLTALGYLTWDVVDHLMLTSSLCPVFCIAVPLLLCYNYPKLDNYSPTRADTTTILGSGAGGILGFWINNNYISDASARNVLPSVPLITTEILLLELTKFLVGIGVLVFTRQIVKTVVLKSLFAWYNVPTNYPKAKQQVEIEVPYKFLTYSSIGLSATVLVPLLHRFLDLH